MKKVYFLLLLCVPFVMISNGCKMDPPVLPNDLVPKEAGGSNTGTNPGSGSGGGGIGIGGTNTIKVQIGSGAVKTYSQVNFVTAFGVNSVTGINGSAELFNFSYQGDGVGSFETQTCTFENYSNQLEKKGKVIINENSMSAAMMPKGTIKGTFEIPLVDASDKPVGTIKGSFNITQ